MTIGDLSHAVTKATGWVLPSPDGYKFGSVLNWFRKKHPKATTLECETFLRMVMHEAKAETSTDITMAFLETMCELNEADHRHINKKYKKGKRHGL